MIKTVEIIPTYRCNLRCRGCYPKDGIEQNGELTQLEIMSIRDQVNRMSMPLRPLRLPYIWMLGGEIFLRHDMPDIIHQLVKTNRVGIQTNGTMPEMMVNINGLDMVMFSIDGLENSNDLLRGKGTYGKILKSIKLAKEHNAAKKIGVNIRVMNENIGDIRPLIENLRDIGVGKVQLGVMTSIDNRYGRRHLPKLPKPIENRKLYELFNNTECEWRPNVNLNDLMEWYGNGEWEWSDWKCGYPSSVLKVDPYGNVIPCLNEVIGNIRKEPIKDIWNSVKFKHFRRQIKSVLSAKCAMCCNMRRRTEFSKKMRNFERVT